MSGKYTTSYRQDMRLIKTRPQMGVALMGVAILLIIPFVFGADIDPPLDFPWKAWFKAINLAMAWAVGAAAFNLLLGYTGQISIAHAAFLILGALVGAVMGQTAVGWGVSFFIVLPVAALLGALVGVLVGLPALRVRGLYLFMATLAVHFAAILAFKKYQVANFGFTGIRYNAPEIPAWLHWLPFINPDEEGLFLIKGDFRWYFILLPITAYCLYFMVNVLRSREGRAFVAVRDNDVAASLLGVNAARTKLLAFAVSSAMVTVSGVLLAFLLTARADESWSIEIILDVAIMTVVGGFSTIFGGVAGAVFFFFTPVLFQWIRGWAVLEGFDFLQQNAAAIDLAIFGLAIIVVLRFKPEGLAGVWDDIKKYFRLWPYQY